MPSILILLVSLILAGCSKQPAEQVDEAIDVALSFLSKDKCDEAIDVLEDVGLQEEDAIYLQVLASAYACRAEFDAVDFIGEIEDFNTSTIQALLKSLAIMDLSTETTVDSDAFTDMNTALGVLIESNAAGLTHTQRVATFGARKAGDMSMQILMLSLAQLGKFLNLYGNVNATGTKGAGSGTNSCFINYTYAPAQAVISTPGLTGACTVHNDGHSGLDHTTTAGKRRLCEGLVLFTNILDVLENLEVTSDSLSNLTTAGATAVAVRDLVIAADPDLEPLLTETSQSACETLMQDPTEVEHMQHIFALLYESGLQ